MENCEVLIDHLITFLVIGGVFSIGVTVGWLISRKPDW